MVERRLGVTAIVVGPYHSGEVDPHDLGGWKDNNEAGRKLVVIPRLLLYWDGKVG